MNDLKNYHLLSVKYLGATNYRGSRVKITSDRFEQSVTIPYDYEENTIAGMAQKYLESKGFELVGLGEAKKGYILVSSTFKPLED